MNTAAKAQFIELYIFHYFTFGNSPFQREKNHFKEFVKHDSS